MTELDDVHAVLVEIRELVRETRDDARSQAAEAKQNMETALERQASAVRVGRVAMVVLLVAVGVLWWIGSR